MIFKPAIEAVRHLLFLSRDVEQFKQDIAALKENTASLKQQLDETNGIVGQLALEICHLREYERQEREKFVLRVENALLRGRQLPSSNKRKRRK